MQKQNNRLVRKLILEAVHKAGGRVIPSGPDTVMRAYSSQTGRRQAMKKCPTGMGCPKRWLRGWKAVRKNKSESPGTGRRRSRQARGKKGLRVANIISKALIRECENATITIAIILDALNTIRS